MTATPVKLFRMTIASRVWYDESAQRVREFEVHFKVARGESMTGVRQHLARRGVPYFQQNVYRHQRRWIPKRELRVAFEREEQALQSSRIIMIQVRGMQGRGKRWESIPFPSKTLSYTKRKRTRSGQSSRP